MAGQKLDALLIKQRAPWRQGRIDLIRSAPADIEERRAERLGRALRDKGPKLAAWKRQGARSVLVLEDNDIALSNHILIRQALALAAVRTALPDEVFLVCTTTDNWEVFHFVQRGKMLAEVDSFTEFDRSELQPLAVG